MAVNELAQDEEWTGDHPASGVSASRSQVQRTCGRCRHMTREVRGNQRRWALPGGILQRCQGWGVCEDRTHVHGPWSQQVTARARAARREQLGRCFSIPSQTRACSALSASSFWLILCSRPLSLAGAGPWGVRAAAPRCPASPCGGQGSLYWTCKGGRAAGTQPSDSCLVSPCSVS